MGIIPAEIIAIGSELLIGKRPETNSLFLAERLAAAGVQVRWKTVVGDIAEDITRALTQATRHAKVVVMTGGLGSTVDDCTRKVVSRVTGRPLRLRKHAHEMLKTRYASHGRVTTKKLSQQALLPSGSEILDNPVGSAFGFLVHWRQCIIIVLPGVSREAKAMFDQHVLPKLSVYLKKTHDWSQKAFHTFGLTESEIDERLQPILSTIPSIHPGLLASSHGVTVTLTQWQRLPASKKRQHENSNSDDMVRTEALVRSSLGKFLYAEDNQSMEEIIGQYLSAHHLTIATAESCTGGLIGHRLTQVPGSSRYFDRALVCYSNQAKQDLLGVSPYVLDRYGAVSSQVVHGMACGVRTRSQATIGLGITGIAGPGGGSKEKPVGLVFVGIDSPRGTKTWRFQFHGDRQTIQMRSSQAALDVLRRYLLNKYK